MNECEEVRQSLVLIAGGATDERGTEKVRRHIAVCPSCAERYRSMSALCDSLRNMGREADAIAPPEHIHQAVVEALHRAPRPILASRGWRVAAVAAAVVAALGGYLVFSAKRRPTPDTSALKSMPALWNSRTCLPMPCPHLPSTAKRARCGLTILSG